MIAAAFTTAEAKALDSRVRGNDGSEGKGGQVAIMLSKGFRWGNSCSIMRSMGILYRQNNWVIKVQGNEHLPVHVHVLHPDGKALIELDGTTLNRHVPAAVIKVAQAWVAAHADVIRAEWARMNNPKGRAS